MYGRSPGISWINVSVGSAAEPDDMPGEQEKHEGDCTLESEGGRAHTGSSCNPICTIFWIALIFLLTCTGTAVIGAIQSPEALCPIAGIAGLFGPDGSSFFRHWIGKRDGRKDKKHEESSSLDQCLKTSHEDVEDEPLECSPDESLQNDGKQERIYETDTIKHLSEETGPYNNGKNIIEWIEEAPETLIQPGDIDFTEEADTDNSVPYITSFEVDLDQLSLDDQDGDSSVDPHKYHIDSQTELLTHGEESVVSFEPGGGSGELSPAIIVGSSDLPDAELYSDDRPIEVLIDDLGSDHSEIWERAVGTIVERGSEAITPLIDSLSSADDRRRWCVAEALANIGDDAIPALIAALGDDAVQAGAAATLVRIGKPAVPSLIAALTDSDDEIQFGARYALQEIGDESIPYLVDALNAPDREIRTSVAGILKRLGWNPTDNTSAIHYHIAREAWLDVVEYGPPAIQPLIHILRSPDREAWWSAARTLGEIGEPAVEPLIDLLHEVDDEITPLVAMALGEIGEPAVLPLVALLSDPPLKSIVTKVLTKLGEDAVGDCIQALDNVDTDVQDSIYEVLIAIGEPAVPALTLALTSNKSGVRGHVAEILGQMGWKPWNDTEQAWYFIAREAWTDLALMGSLAVDPLIRALNSDDTRIRCEVSWTLGEIGEPTAVDPLVALLADDNIAPAAVDALVGIGGAAIIPVLEQLEEGSDAVRERAVEILGRLGAHEAVPTIVDLLRAGGDHLYRKAIDALIAIGEPSIDALIPLLGEEGDEYEGAIAALSGIGHVAQEPLLEVLSDNDARIRMGAAMALKRLGWVPTGTEEVAYLIALQHWQEVSGFGKSAIEHLVARLSDPDADVQTGAAAALALIGSHAVPPLIPLLGKAELQELVGSTLAEIGEPAIEPLITALGEDDVSQAAAEVLIRIGEPAAAALVPMLGRADIGEVVVVTLMAMGDQPIVHLIKALGDTDAQIRQIAGGLLICIGDTVITPLVGALGHPNDSLRLGAIETLARIGKPAIPALVGALVDEHYNVRLGAAEILGRAGWEPKTEEEVIRHLIAKEQWISVAEVGAGAVGPLIQALDDPDCEIQMGAARALALIGEPAVSELIWALSDDRVDEQRKVVEALKMIGEPAVEPLIDALQDRDWQIRLGSARALIAIGDPAIEQLIRALQTGSDLTRMGVAAVLGKIGNPAAIDPLADTLLRDDWRVGRVVVRALSMMGEPAIKPLLRVIREGSDAARRGAVAALVLIGKPAVRLLPGALTDWHFRVRAGVAEALDRLGWTPESSEEMAYYLIAKEQWSDLFAMGVAAVEPLVRMLSDRDDGIRRRAAKVLGSLRDQRAVLPLIDLLHDDYYSIRREAAAALIAIGDPAVDSVMIALGDEDVDIRKRAADILAEIGDVRALGALEAIFDDDDWYVRRAAVAAADRIREREK